MELDPNLSCKCKGYVTNYQESWHSHGNTATEIQPTLNGALTNDYLIKKFTLNVKT